MEDYFSGYTEIGFQIFLEKFTCIFQFSYVISSTVSYKKQDIWAKNQRILSYFVKKVPIFDSHESSEHF